MTDEQALNYLRGFNDDFISQMFDRIETIKIRDQQLKDCGHIWLDLAIEHGRINTILFLLDKLKVPEVNMDMNERICYYKLFIKGKR